MRRWVAIATALSLLLAGCAANEQPDPTAPPELPPLATLPPPVVVSPAPAATAPAPAATAPAATATTPGPTAPMPDVVPRDPRLVDRLQRLLDEWRDDDGAPGAVLGLRLADGGTAIVASGQTDDAGGFAVEPADRFRIGSVTKTFVAVLLVQLVAEGRLELDDRLADHLPSAPHADRVTVRQLLDHTSGMPDFAGLADYRQRLLADPGRRWDARETVALVADRALDFEPGSRWSYSNTNYVLAGLIAEEVAGGDLAQLLGARISAPLALDSTFLEDLEPAPPIETAGHYDLDGDGRPENVRPIPYTALVTSGAAAGGLSSTALDVLDFATGVFGGRLLDDEGRQVLTTSPEAYAGYGLGVAIFERRDRVFWGHAGALPGYSALFAYAPEEEISVVALANRSGADLQRLLERAFMIGEGEARTAGGGSS